jgi:hypothetical protein
MHDAERRVARLAPSLEHDAEGDHVVDVVERDALRLHLVVDGRQLLRPPLDLGLDAGSGELRGERADHLFDVLLPLLAASLELPLQLRRRLGLQRAEGVVLELAAQPVDAEPVREGHVDPLGLLRDAPARVLVHVLERAHVVESVGELDHQDADVLRHRDQHLSEVLGLPLLGVLELELRDLGEPLDQEGHLVAEQAPELLHRGERVLHGVVEQARRDRDRVEPHLGQDAGHLERVDQVGLPREPLLPLVDLGREHVGALQQREIALRVVLEDPIRDVVEAQHALRLAAGRPGAWRATGRPRISLLESLCFESYRRPRSAAKPAPNTVPARARGRRGRRDRGRGRCGHAWARGPGGLILYPRILPASARTRSRNVSSSASRRSKSL